jgi:hypothetical protein
MIVWYLLSFILHNERLQISVEKIASPSESPFVWPPNQHPFILRSKMKGNPLKLLLIDSSLCILILSEC